MKRPPERGCGDYSRHAPKAAERGGGRACPCHPRRGGAAPRHTPAPLQRGNGSEKAGPEACGRVHRRGRVFLRLRCRLRPAGCRAPSLLPQRERGRLRCRSAAEGHGTAQQTAGRGDDEHPAPMLPELLPLVPCWGAAGGGLETGRDSPPSPAACLPRLVGLSPTVAAAEGPGSSQTVQEVAVEMDPAVMLGKAVSPVLPLRVPVGRGARGERGSSAWVHAGQGGHPTTLRCPSGVSG